MSRNRLGEIQTGHDGTSSQNEFQNVDLEREGDGLVAGERYEMRERELTMSQFLAEVFVLL